MTRAEPAGVDTHRGESASPGPVKLLVVCARTELLGGAERVLWRFISSVDRGRVSPTLVVFGEGGLARDARAAGIPTIVVPGGRLRHLPRTLANIVRLARIYRSEQPQVILHWLVRAQLFGGPAVLLNRMGSRSTWSQRDFPLGQSSDPLLSRIAAWIAMRLATILPAADIVTCSHSVAVAQQRLRPRRSCTAIWPGIDSHAALAPQQLDRLRREFALRDGVPVVASVGRLVSWKNHHELIRAVALMRDRGRKVQLLVVGGTVFGIEPAYGERLKSLRSELGVEDLVTFLGQIPDARGLLPLVDVSANASSPEPFGLGVVEAMAAGVPVVAVDSGGPTEILDHGRAGVLVASPSAEDLAAGIELVLDDRAHREKIVAAARDRAARCFTTERMVEDLTLWTESMAAKL